MYHKTQADLIAGVGQSKYAAASVFALIYAENHTLPQKQLKNLLSESFQIDPKTVEAGLRNAGKKDLFDIATVGNEKVWTLTPSFLENEVALERVSQFILDAYNPNITTFKELKAKVKDLTEENERLKERGEEFEAQEKKIQTLEAKIGALEDTISGYDKITRDKFEFIGAINNMIPLLSSIRDQHSQETDDEQGKREPEAKPKEKVEKKEPQVLE